MTSDQPIRIDNFQAESRRIRSGCLQRQYQLSTTLAALLFVISCTVVVTTRQTADPQRPVPGLAVPAQR